MTVFTAGYGGTNPTDFGPWLKARGVGTVVDVRHRPDRANVGLYQLAKDPGKGIVKLLADSGVAYVSLVELGNPFVELPDWRERYARLLAGAADVMMERLLGLLQEQPVATPPPYCLLCCEKDPEGCHRSIIAERLAAAGYEVSHIVP